jgi:hypothetical protein
MPNIIEKSKLTLDYKGLGIMNKNDKNQMNHYRATVRYNRKQFTIDFFTGLGWTKEPNIKDVLSSMVMDYSSMDMEVEDFMREFGYNNYYEAEHILNKLNKNCRKLEKIFGSDGIKELQELLQDY